MPKGIYKRTPEMRTGKHMFGRKFSKKTKQKMSKALKGKIPYIMTDKIKERISKALKGRYVGKNSPSWKGGRFKGKGYTFIYFPTHPFSNSRGYVRKGRLVMEKLLKRYLIPFEVIHHINGIKDNDRPKNLKLTTRAEHIKFHCPEKYRWG